MALIGPDPVPGGMDLGLQSAVRPRSRLAERAVGEGEVQFKKWSQENAKFFLNSLVLFAAICKASNFLNSVTATVQVFITQSQQSTGRRAP